ncbi:hypothetical protein NEF87_000503 [Candidatus Lokiarchaeum ossiferum]|uniref:Uncharacterized protein n=1 Tax=Candidatus Lokiarchaeum ossiferum TaxID=2951803 RepID=A0ABY6HL24_9ARCH|nr:hypothetical protein NEF87_000503 [Candidatus Lokiarchaeum sp. B-35]
MKKTEIKKKKTFESQPEANHRISLRLDSETNKMLDTYSKIVSTTKTQLIRDSVSSIMFLNLGNPKYHNPKSIFSQSMLHFLFDRCNDEDLLELAQISYDLSMSEIAKMDPKENFLDPKFPEILAEYFVKYILSPKGHGWFDECKSHKRGKFIYIVGSHNLGPKFHIFLIHLINLYFAQTGYEVQSDRQNPSIAGKNLKKYDMRHVSRKFYKFAVKLSPFSLD